uniref:Putative colostrum trypsin inhibitor n=1 Tax=Ixodes scapularis TaxID=6945 RepID=A0A4D5RPM3_IXOSC
MKAFFLVSLLLCVALATALRRPPSCFQTLRVTGRCKALIVLFSYDQRSRLCKKYIYQGCSANGNNFETLEDCQRKCEALPPSFRSPRR